MTDSRFSVREWPEVPPSKCMICGAQHKRDGRQYLDFGLNIARYGAVYFCTLCIGEAATMIGYLDPKVARQLETDWNKLNSEVEQCKDENGRLRRALSELDFLGNIRNALSIGNEQSESGENGLADSSDESINDTERRAEAESGSDESNDVVGSSDISSDESIDDILSSI